MARSPFLEYPHRRAPEPLGQARAGARAIEAIDLPYMKARRPDGSVAHKSGEFMTLDRKRVEEVKITTYLWGDALFPADFLTGSFGPQFNKLTEHAYGTVITDSTYSLPNSFYLYAGDGYLWRLACKVDSSAFWPVLVRETLGNEFAPSPVNAGNSISFFSTAKLDGGVNISEFSRGMALVASGHDGSAYRVGFSGMYEFTQTAVIASGGPNNGNTSGNNHATETRAWFTNTATFAVTSHTFGVAGREASPARVQHSGPGRLLALQTFPEQLDTVTFVSGSDYLGTYKAQLAPKLLRSTNHGSTWSQTEASFLLPYLKTVTTQGPGRWSFFFVSSRDRDAWSNTQLLSMALGARFIYVGGNTVLLIVPQCWVGADDYATLLFRSTDGGASFSRIAWPPDAWTGLRPNVTSFSGIFINACWSLGDGHAFVPFEDDDFEVRVLYTLDSGSTWQTGALAVPSEYRPSLTKAFFPTPVRPGVGLMAKREAGQSRITWSQVGKTFSSLLQVGSVALAAVPSDDGIGYAGRFFAYIGDGFVYPRRVNAAYPAEFNE